MAIKRQRKQSAWPSQDVIFVEGNSQHEYKSGLNEY